MMRAFSFSMAGLLLLPAMALAEPLRLGGVTLAEAMRQPAIVFPVVDREVDRRIPQRAVKPSAQSGAPSQRRSVWRSPWPYVIGGGAAAIVIVAARGDGTSQTNSSLPGAN